MNSEIAVPVLYLDLDGTVRHGHDELGRFVNGPDDVVVFPEAVEMMKRWRAGGGRICGVSNQGGIALGHVSYTDVASAMIATHEATGSMFDRILFCKHHPGADDPEMARCWCRKPSAGAIAEAAAGLRDVNRGEFYPPYMALMVGDSDTDRQCAEQASLDFMWAAQWREQARTLEG